MLTKDFYFDLPEKLIAQYPSEVRGNDRLMVLNRCDKSIKHCHMQNLVDLIGKDTLMVFNDSKVRRSRCYAQKENAPLSKKTEFLLLDEVDAEDAQVPAADGGARQQGTGSAGSQPNGGQKRLWRAMVKQAKKKRIGDRFVFADGTVGTIAGCPEGENSAFRTLFFEKPQSPLSASQSVSQRHCAPPNGTNRFANEEKHFMLDEAWFERNGHIPLPPYIKRNDTEKDAQRYQTVYAKNIGSAACPTAGLHFTQSMLDALKEKGVELCTVTLHVGLGTFLPVRTDTVEAHVMHEEVYTVSPETAQAVNRAKKEGKSVLAVGTTSVRTLEAAWKDGALQSGTGSTRIFLYPPCTFHAVDRMFTNFHTPESTLLMLVSAFAGREYILEAYRQAVEQEYRFFSYGDAMLIM